MNKTNAGRILVLRKPTAFNLYHTVIGTLLDKVANLTGTLNLRKVQPKDNSLVRELIQRILVGRGGVGVDRHYYDKELSDIFETYEKPGSFFNVLTSKNTIIGTVGICPFHDADQFSNSCEIKKLYITSGFSNQGHENIMLQAAKSKAWNFGYNSCVIFIENRELELMKILVTEGFEIAKIDKGKMGICQLVYFFNK